MTIFEPISVEWDIYLSENRAHCYHNHEEKVKLFLHYKKYSRTWFLKFIYLKSRNIQRSAVNWFICQMSTTVADPHQRWELWTQSICIPYRWYGRKQLPSTDHKGKCGLAFICNIRNPHSTLKRIKNAYVHHPSMACNCKFVIIVYFYMEQDVVSPWLWVIFLFFKIWVCR